MTKNIQAMHHTAGGVIIAPNTAVGVMTTAHINYTIQLAQ